MSVAVVGSAGIVRSHFLSECSHRHDDSCSNEGANPFLRRLVEINSQHVHLESVATGDAQLVVCNARIHTDDPFQPSASAAAISNGVFTAVGDDKSVAAQIGLGTRVVDALGRRVIPGLNESHMHVIRGGLDFLLELRWDGVRCNLAALRPPAWSHLTSVGWVIPRRDCSL
jgi:hypothetical protein